LRIEVPLEKRSKKFHFQELDWIISFPDVGNEGRKYLYYSVSFTNRKKGNLKAKMCLADVLENPEFETNLPHTVGFFRESTDTSVNAVLAYLELRIIRSIEEFWKFLNDLNL
jgi:hypothetical protein